MLGYSFMGISLPGRDSLPRLGEERGASTITVSPGYFRTTGVPLVAGRDFSAADQRGGQRVIIVSQAMARTYWPGENAIGKCVVISGSKDCTLVVGVAADVHRMTVIEKPVMQTYIPTSQASEFMAADELMLRASTKNLAAVKALTTAELRRTFPMLWSSSVKTVEQSLESQFRPWRLGATLFTAFGLLALVVAAVGIYSIVAYAVTQRTHEMGVRIALGARRADVIGLVLNGGLRVVGLGFALGVVTSLALGHIVASLLYGVQPNDPWILAGAAVGLGALAAVACLVPGWRAAKVNPVEALKAE
jgi:putative ABC transport system permease protein